LFRPEQPLPPPFAHRPGMTIDISENFKHHSMDDATHKWDFALRGGEFVLVREETWGGEITDWDRRGRWFLARSYPRLPRVLSNRPNEIISVAALRDL
jgi:hypothetical protein